ncbi:hypothetical protein B0H17DRAFT_1132749 [Mycena rosella]|uniref:Uncharacterized protein n=1 Tax=Mycena rosella TaxID=1033263 RepID=A0AAD7DJT7_MYCRO|nr:hypothetical protein B0H17DRAFT_1132749 [Mycena rosella]
MNFLLHILRIPRPHPPLLWLLQIPTNSNVVAAAPCTRTRKYGRNVAFAAGYIEICQVMGLDPMTARLGYKWDNDKANAPSRQLADAGDWAECLENGIGMTERARSRKVVCLIKNLDTPKETAPIANSKKRKSAHTAANEKHTFDFTKEHRQLKTHLVCATHKGELCFVSSVDGHHHRVDLYHVSLWAKEISVGNATTARPPENIVLQDFFVPTAKRACTIRAGADTSSSATPCAPTIHVTVNTGTGGKDTYSSPTRCSPLGTITAAAANASHVGVPNSLHRSSSRTFGSPGDENSGLDTIHYLPVTDILQQIDDWGILEDSVVLTFPAIIFADTLRELQIERVDQVPLLDTDFYVQQVNIPVELAELFVEESIAALGREHKGKLAM